MNWPTTIDRVINRLKWPVAWLVAVMTPLLAWALWQLSLRAAVHPWPLAPFFLGIAVFIIGWRRWLAKSRIGRFVITLEHELTHALFAWLTGHRLVAFRASLGRGGEVRFTGPGNWLIAVAPYFFPTAALALFLIAYLLPFPRLPWQGFLLGVALGYHLVSTYRETHRDQTDIRQLGLLFCWLFLPAANLLVVGLLISFAHGGPQGTSDWFGDIFDPIESWFDWSRQSWNWLIGGQNSE